MTAKTAQLKTGEQLVIKTLHPPLGDYVGKVGCWGAIRDELLNGELTEWLFTPYFVGEIEGEVVGSMSYYTPTDTRDVGVVEFVQTAEQHRQKGIASALMETLIERFRDDRGLALDLCTTNPVAGSLYEKHGFWYNIGDGMRYVAPGAEDFNSTYLTHCGTARVRDAAWSDLPRASILYNHPEPRWFIKDCFTETFRDTRFESHYLKLMRGIEGNRGVFVALENPKQRLVGTAVLQRFDTFYEQHVATLSFRVCPAYLDQTAELLNAAAQKAEAISINTLQTYIADCDDDQKRLVTAAGFAEEARLRNRLRDGDGFLDVLIYTRSLETNTVPPFHEQAHYYGNRKPWQAERVNE